MITQPWPPNAHTFVPKTCISPCQTLHIQMKLQNNFRIERGSCRLLNPISALVDLKWFNGALRWFSRSTRGNPTSVSTFVRCQVNLFFKVNTVWFWKNISNIHTQSLKNDCSFIVYILLLQTIIKNHIFLKVKWYNINSKWSVNIKNA